jgi:hypothetical protein
VKYFRPWVWLMAARRKLFGNYGLLGHYQPHPDPNQERFFFGLLRECLDKGVVTEELLRDQMKRDYIRHDALDLLRRTAPLQADPLAA